MYKAFYGLNDKPFRLTPDPEGLFLSPTYKRALTYLEYGFLESASIILLTGEVGTGKTTLVNHVRRRNVDHLQTALISNTNVTPEELLELMLQGFGIEDRPASKPQALEMLRRHFATFGRSDHNGLLIIDDAQNLSIKALEEIRMLFSLEEEPHSGLQVFLVGQPELRDRLQAPQLTSLAQRVGVNYHLPPLDPKEVVDYIEHRIQHVGGPKGLFDKKALAKIAVVTGGIPRTINQLCEAALVYGYGYNQEHIGATIIQQVITDRSGFGLGGRAKKQTAASASPSEGATPSGNHLEAFNDRLQTLERSVVKLTAHLSGQVPPSNKSEGAGLQAKFTRAKQMLAKEQRLRIALAKEIKQLKQQLNELEMNPPVMAIEQEGDDAEEAALEGAQIHRFKL